VGGRGRRVDTELRMSTVLASAADEPYGYHLLNLIGSVKANSDVFERIVVYDLGLSPHQRRLADSVRGVEVRTVTPFVPHWAQCFTWKPWIWTQIDAAEVIYLDAGTTVLRSLGPAIEQIRSQGYFLVSQGNALRDIVPPDYFELYGLPETVAERPYVAAGIIGFRPDGDFFRRVLVPTYEDCLEGRNLGFSAEEAETRNQGLGRTDQPTIRNCRHFRWDQTIVNARLARDLPDAFVNDLDEYAGWRSPRDHSRQVIWSHRRRGNLRYLKRVPYGGRGALSARAFGAGYQLRWWLKMNERYRRRTTYELKARKTLSGLRR
jgi:hypothetical protein